MCARLFISYKQIISNNINIDIILTIFQCEPKANRKGAYERIFKWMTFTISMVTYFLVIIIKYGNWCCTTDSTDGFFPLQEKHSPEISFKHLVNAFWMSTAYFKLHYKKQTKMMIRNKASTRKTHPGNDTIVAWYKELKKGAAINGSIASKQNATAKTWPKNINIISENRY